MLYGIPILCFEYTNCQIGGDVIDNLFQNCSIHPFSFYTYDYNGRLINNLMEKWRIGFDDTAKHPLNTIPQYPLDDMTV